MSRSSPLKIKPSVTIVQRALFINYSKATLLSQVFFLAPLQLLVVLQKHH